MYSRGRIWISLTSFFWFFFSWSLSSLSSRLVQRSSFLSLTLSRCLPVLFALYFHTILLLYLFTCQVTERSMPPLLLCFPLQYRSLCIYQFNFCNNFGLVIIWYSACKTQATWWDMQCNTDLIMFNRDSAVFYELQCSGAHSWEQKKTERTERWMDERSEPGGSCDDHVLSSYSSSQPPDGGGGAKWRPPGLGLIPQTLSSPPGPLHGLMPQDLHSSGFKTGLWVFFFLLFGLEWVEVTGKKGVLNLFSRDSDAMNLPKVIVWACCRTTCALGCEGRIYHHKMFSFSKLSIHTACFESLQSGEFFSIKRVKWFWFPNRPSTFSSTFARVSYSYLLSNHGTAWHSCDSKWMRQDSRFPQ